MTDFDTILAEIDADKRRIQAQEWLLIELRLLVRKLESHGFRPCVTAENGFVGVRVDIDDCDPPAAPAEDDAAPQPAPVTQSRAKPQPTIEERGEGPASGGAGVGQPGADPAREAGSVSKAAEAGERRPAAAGGSPAPDSVSGPWSEAEIARAREIIGRGGTNREVAETLGRHMNNVASRCSSFRQELKRAARKPAGEGSARPAPAPAAPRSPAPGGSSAAHVIAMAGSERQVRQRLELLGHPAPWTPQTDLALVEGLVRGDGLSATAERIGVARDVARDRWNQLCPEVTIANQQVVLRVLRDRLRAA